MNNLVEILTYEDYQEKIKGHAMMVFSASWCPDCHFLKTFINDLVSDNPDWVFYYVDRDKMIDLCVDLDILGIPSFIAYDDSKEVGRLVNKLRKSQEDIQSFIDGLK